MLLKKMRNLASALSDVAGVMGFILAVSLGWLTWQDHRESIQPALRLTAFGSHSQLPFVRETPIPTNIVAPIRFTIHHDSGPDVLIQTVCLRLSANADTNSYHTGRGFGPEGVFDMTSNTNIYLFCWELSSNGSLDRDHPHMLPFSKGSSRQYFLPSEGLLLAYGRQRTNIPHFATLEVWSQDRIISSFDVSREVLTLQMESRK